MKENLLLILLLLSLLLLFYYYYFIIIAITIIITIIVVAGACGNGHVIFAQLVVAALINIAVESSTSFIAFYIWT